MVRWLIYDMFITTNIWSLAVFNNPPYKGWEKLCKVPLTVETNAASNIKLFYELLTEICRSAVMINANVNTVNEILKILLQKIGINES